MKEKGTGLFHWFFNQKGIVNGYNNVLWTGITTLELAKAIDEAIRQDINGLYHLVPNQKISKYELLQLIKKTWNLPLEILKVEKPINDKSLINNRKDFLYDIPNYEIMLKDLYNWMRKHDYYNLYQT